MAEQSSGTSGVQQASTVAVFWSNICPSGQVQWLGASSFSNSSTSHVGGDGGDGGGGGGEGDAEIATQHTMAEQSSGTSGVQQASTVAVFWSNICPSGQVQWLGASS